MKTIRGKIDTTNKTSKISPLRKTKKDTDVWLRCQSCQKESFCDREREVWWTMSQKKKKLQVNMIRIKEMAEIVVVYTMYNTIFGIKNDEWKYFLKIYKQLEWLIDVNIRNKWNVHLHTNLKPFLSRKKIVVQFSNIKIQYRLENSIFISLRNVNKLKWPRFKFH